MRRNAATWEAQLPDDARYDHGEVAVGSSVVTADQRMVAFPYGADIDPAIWDAPSCLSIAMPDLARLLASYSLAAASNPILPNAADLLTKGYGFDPTGTFDGAGRPMFTRAKSGLLEGCSANCEVGADGISFAVAFNKDIPFNLFSGSFADLRSAIAASTFPTADQFPTYGMTSFA